MRFTTLASITFLATLTAAAPTEYGPPPGGWESIDWTKIEYPPGTGENLDHYPTPPGGYGTYPPATPPKPSPFFFTSTFNVIALGSEVLNGTTPAPGAPKAIGYFNYGINSELDTICYNITLFGVIGDYKSPAKTATHIHEAARGASGPPRIAFPNPIGDDNKRVSLGCLMGPFTTGLNNTAGLDTGTGFKVKQIEDNPAGFFTDSHTVLFPLGVVRGQLA